MNHLLVIPDDEFDFIEADLLAILKKHVLPFVWSLCLLDSRLDLGIESGYLGPDYFVDFLL